MGGVRMRGSWVQNNLLALAQQLCMLAMQVECGAPRTVHDALASAVAECAREAAGSEVLLLVLECLREAALATSVPESQREEEQGTGERPGCPQEPVLSIAGSAYSSQRGVAGASAGSCVSPMRGAGGADSRGTGGGMIAVAGKKPAAGGTEGPIGRRVIWCGPLRVFIYASSSIFPLAQLGPHIAVTITCPFSHAAGIMRKIVSPSYLTHKWGICNRMFFLLHTNCTKHTRMICTIPQLVCQYQNDHMLGVAEFVM